MKDNETKIVLQITRKERTIYYKSITKILDEKECMYGRKVKIRKSRKRMRIKNQSGYEPLNLENGSFVNSDNFDATDWQC